MKAMILAAGLGTRLRPLTEKIPKALVPINGVPLLELVIRKLINCGVTEVVINTHHFAEKISEFIREKNYFDISIEFSHEDVILGTGGGLLNVADKFWGDEEPFFLHNVDILSTIDLKKMYDFHKNSGSLATLAVQKRDNNRVLLVDRENNICGHENKLKNQVRLRRQPAGDLMQVGFCGVHVISPRIFEIVKFSGPESIIDIYLDLIAKNHLLKAFDVTNCYWKDIGKIYSLEEIADDFKNGVIDLEKITSCDPVEEEKN